MSETYGRAVKRSPLIAAVMMMAASIGGIRSMTDMDTPPPRNREPDRSFNPPPGTPRLPWAPKVHQNTKENARRLKQRQKRNGMPTT